jgi:hypothetical protein
VNIHEGYVSSSTVSVSFEVEPQLEDVIVKLTSETSFIGILPLAVNNLERDVLQTTNENIDPRANRSEQKE